MYNIDIEEFQGPLELLNHLIEKNKIDIYDIPISEITDQYLKYIEAMKDLNLDITSEFILLASNLLVIKSKMLLPKSKEEEDPREELVNKILEYRKYKIVSKQMKERNERYSKIYYKLKEDIDYIEAVNELNFDTSALVKAYKNVLKNISNKDRIKTNENDEKTEGLIENIKRDVFSVEEGISIIEIKLNENKIMKFKDLFFNIEEKYKVITLFIALLELIKIKKVKVVQENLFDDIIINKVEILEEERNFES